MLKTVFLAAALALPSSGLTVDASAKVDSQPGNPAYGFGSVWVPSSGSGKLDRVNPKTLHVIARIPSTKVTAFSQNQYFDSVAVSKTAVWHASDLGNVVVRINPHTNKVVARVSVPGRPDEVAAGPTGVYTGLFNTNAILRISAQTNKVARTRDLGAPVLGVAFGAGKLWALAGTSVLQLDPATLAVKTRVSVKSTAPNLGGFAPAWWLAADAKTVCVGNLQQNTVSIVDPSTAKLVAQVTLPFGTKPFSVAAANGKCWATNDSGVFLASPDGSAVAYSHLPPLGASEFTGVASSAGEGWVTLAGKNELVRVQVR